MGIRTGDLKHKNSTIIEHIINTIIIRGETNFWCSLGELRTAVQLDREDVPEYSLVAHVRDRDTPGWDCTCHLSIVIGDVNDNPPYFTSGNYTAAITEHYKVGSFVTILHAADKDSGKLQSVSPEATALAGSYVTMLNAAGKDSYMQRLWKNTFYAA